MATLDVADVSDSVWSIVSSSGVRPSDKSLIASVVNYPNPVSTEGTIEFTLARTQSVQLEVVNARGERVAFLVDASLPPGHYSSPLNVAELPAGAYYYTFVTSEGRVTRPLIVQH